MQFASCDHYPYDQCNLFQVKSEQIITNLLGLCSHESVLVFLCIMDKKTPGGFEYKMSFEFLSFSLSLWVILSSFSSSCSVTTWQSFDFYMRAAQTPTAKHVRVLSLSRSLVSIQWTSSQRMQVLCNLFTLCSGLAGGPLWPSLIYTNSPYTGGMLLQTSPLWSAVDIMTPSPLPPNREHYNVNTVKMLWTNVLYHANSI